MFHMFCVNADMTNWKEDDFYTAILYWKGVITLQEAINSNPTISAASWKLRRLQYEQIYRNTRKRGNDLKPIGKRVFEKFKNHHFDDKDRVCHLGDWIGWFIFGNR